MDKTVCWFPNLKYTLTLMSLAELSWHPATVEATRKLMETRTQAALGKLEKSLS